MPNWGSIQFYVKKLHTVSIHFYKTFDGVVILYNNKYYIIKISTYFTDIGNFSYTRIQLPMTEIHWYHISTAENELGVVIATAEGSPQGVTMVPINWSEMQCPKSFVKEPRKVARVIPENINQDIFPTGDKEKKK